MLKLLKYQKVESFLLNELSSGKFKEGDRFYSETEIAQRFDLNVRTVRQAFANLVKNKLVIRMRPQGTFVQQIPERPTSFRIFNHCLIGVLITRRDTKESLKLGLMIYELQRAIEAAGYLAVISGHNPASLSEMGVKGVVALSTIAESERKMFELCSVPVIESGSRDYNTGTGIICDVQHASTLLASCFANHGAQHLAIVGDGDHAIRLGEVFSEPLEKSASKLGMKFSNCITPRKKFEGKFRTMMKQNLRPDALFITSFRDLGGVEMVLRELDIVIGQDVSVVVQGSSAMAISSIPAYSTFDIDMTELANIMIAYLTELIRNPDAMPPPKMVHFLPVVIRGSLIGSSEN